MVMELIWGLVGFTATAGTFAAGYALGNHSSDEGDTEAFDTEEAYQRGRREAEEMAGHLFADDWDKGYNAGLEAGRDATKPDPAALTYTASAARDARLPWMARQTKNHMSSYKDLFWRLLEVARDVGERYRKVESLGQGGLAPIGDALNICIYVADIAKQYDDVRVLQLPHGGVYQGKAS